MVDEWKKTPSTRQAVEEAIRKSKEQCRTCGKPLPWEGLCLCRGRKKEER